MKVYVDFKDLDVEDKPTYICNKYNLQVKSINSGSVYKNVELVNITDYDKQIRKEVVQEIRGKLEPYFNFEGDEFIDTNDLERILNQIEKGGENGKIDTK